MLQKELEGKQKELEPFSKKLNEAQSAVNLTQSELEILMSNFNKHVTLLQDTRANIQKVNNTLITKKKSLNRLGFLKGKN